MNQLVSVVIPAYKSAYLFDAISSVLSQTYKNLELIIVNDASPEDITSIVESFNDPRIRYYINERNIGALDLVKNWNLCLSYAQGDFFCLLCDDDMMSETFLEELLGLSTKYPQNSVFRCRVKVIDKLGKMIRIYPSSPEWISGIDYMLHLVNGWQHQTISEFLYRRDYLLSKGGFVSFPKAWCADWFSILNLVWQQGLVTSSKILMTFRDSGINISSEKKYIREKIIAQNIFTERLKGLLKNEVNREMSDIINQARDEIINKIYFEYLGQSSWIDFLFLLINHNEKEYNIPLRCFVKAFMRKLSFTKSYKK